MPAGPNAAPGIAATPDAKRLDIKDATTLTKIPVLPISYGDAHPLLAALKGPMAPEEWRGSLPISYHIGPGAKVHLKVQFNWDTKPVNDVIAKIPGSIAPDEWIIRGNHHRFLTSGTRVAQRVWSGGDGRGHVALHEAIRASDTPKTAPNRDLFPKSATRDRFGQRHWYAGAFASQEIPVPHWHGNKLRFIAVLQWCRELPPPSGPNFPASPFQQLQKQWEKFDEFDTRSHPA